MSPMNESVEQVIRQGDARELGKQLAPRSVDAIVTDPPYGEGILDEGDESPAESAKLLREVLQACRPRLKPGAHVVLWWSSRSVDLCIEAGKAAGLVFARLLSMYVPQGSARPYLGWLPRVQPIVVMRAPGRTVPLWRVQPAEILRQALQAQGMTPGRLARLLGCNNRLVTKWVRADDGAWCYPNDEHRAEIRRILGVELPPAPEKVYRPARHDIYQVAGGQSEAGHPCEKPLTVVEDIVSRVVEPGGTCLDPFCGSGTTLIACRRWGVHGIGFEIDPIYYYMAGQRLRQGDLF